MDEEKRITQKDALETFHRFQVVLKIAKIYEVNNLILQEQIKELFSHIQKAFEDEGEAIFRYKLDCLFFNKTRLKFDYSNYHVFKFIVEEFKSKDLAVVNFLPDLTEDEMGQFMIFLAKKEVSGGKAFDQLIAGFKEKQFPNIYLERIPPSEKDQSRERNMARMYFLGIHILKEITEKEKKEEVFNLNIAKRWMQVIYNLIVENESFVYGLTNIKNYQDYTLNHSINVSILSMALARRLGLTKRELIELGVSAFLHDLGKLEISKEIWEKPAKLTDEEREIVEKHPFLGAERLIQIKSLKNIPIRAIQVAFEHHVKANLTGYPKYYRKKTIDFFSRIVKIADYFDALTTKRVYRTKVFTKEEALSLMQEKSGEEFDPLILKAFVNMIGSYPVGSLVALDSGELAIVFEANSQEAFRLRPKVKLISDEKGNKIDGPIFDLTQVDGETKKFNKTIVKSLDPDEYGIQVSDYFLAQAY